MSFKFSLDDLVRMEIRHLERRGARIPTAFRSAVKKAGDDHGKLMAIYRRLCRLPRARRPYFSQSALGAILRARPRYKGARLRRAGRGRIADRIAGGWYGRAAGCILGKPLECGLTLEDIRKHLGRDFPITNYLRYAVARKVCLLRKPKLHPGITRPCSREHLKYAMEDDDLNYTLLNLILLESKGRGFATADVGEVWASHLPPGCTWGAETTAFVNFLSGLPLAEVPVHLNPFREEIGAQIRADTFGYVCPADPEGAAAMAYRDAVFSHVSEGIYGSMLFAAAIAAAFGMDKASRALDAGLAQIPENCRTAALVRQTRAWHARGLAWEEVYARIKGETPDLHAGSTENNAAYVANALLAGGGDFGQTIAIAVMQGHDTDCNGATAGSLMGVLLGRRRLPAKWIAPLADRIHTSLRGHADCRISDLVKRTVRFAMGRSGRR